MRKKKACQALTPGRLFLLSLVVVTRLGPPREQELTLFRFVGQEGSGIRLRDRR